MSSQNPITVSSSFNPNIDFGVIKKAAPAIFGASYVDINQTSTHGTIDGAFYTVYLSSPVANQQALLDSLVAGSNATYLSVKSVNDANNALKTWAQAMVVNVALWVNILKALDDKRFLFIVSGATQSTIIAALKAQVDACIDVFVGPPAFPAAILTEFDKERVLRGSTLAAITKANVDGLAVNAANVTELRIIIQALRDVALEGLSVAVASTFTNQ